MPLKPHPTDPDKLVYVSRQYEIPQSYRYVKTVHECKPVYVAQRSWIDLTDEDIFCVLNELQAIYNGPPTTDTRVIFARAIEAKLRSKNT
jgi:hypothetical protein